MMMISCGFTVGAALGGFASVTLIASFGWRSVFYFGGGDPDRPGGLHGFRTA